MSFANPFIIVYSSGPGYVRTVGASSYQEYLDLVHSLRTGSALRWSHCLDLDTGLLMGQHRLEVPAEGAAEAKHVSGCSWPD